MAHAVNEDFVFKINEDRVEHLQKFGSVEVLVVDSFYKNPHLVRNLAQTIPPSSKIRRGGYPAHTINASYDLSGLGLVYNDYIQRYFPNRLDPEYVVWNLSQATFMVNVMQSFGNEDMNPHIDNPSGNNVASSIYLNTDEECSGGTSFFENDKFLGYVEMKYNRMILYLQNVQHTAYMEEGSFDGKVYRINQQFFI